MLRFIVPAFVAINLLICQQFLQPRIEEERAGLAELRESIPAVEQEIMDLIKKRVLLKTPRRIHSSLIFAKKAFHRIGQELNNKLFIYSLA